MVTADYTAADDDFTILVDMNNDINKVININLPTPNANAAGRIYIVKAVNLPNSYGPGGGNIGFVSVNNLSLNSYQLNRLYYKYQEGVPVLQAYRFALIDSFTVQCIGSQWRMIAQSVNIWVD